MRDVRETNICRISVHRDDRTGRVIVFAAIDNLWKGAASQAVQNLNLMLGLPEDEGIGATAPFEVPRGRCGDRHALVLLARAGSRSPGNVTEPGGGLPQRLHGGRRGVRDQAERRCSTSACSSRARRRRPARRASRRSGTQSAPVLLCRERVHARRGSARIVVNSGNANAATGRPGFENAVKMQGAAALASRCPESAVAVASTGVIGVPLPMGSVMTGIVRATHALRPDGEVDFAHAIRTTDALDKHACLDVELERAAPCA